MPIHPLMKKQSNTQASHLVKLFAFIRAIYGLKGLPNFFTKQMSTFLKTLIEQRSALVYLDDILLLSNSKEHMFQFLEQFLIIITKKPQNSSSKIRFRAS